MKSDLSDTVPGQGLSLWDRINSDPHYLEEKRVIQARYGLPLAFDIRLETERWSEWLGAAEGSTAQQAERGRAFLEEIQTLFKRFQVPEAWHPDFLANIAGIPADDWSYPKFHLYKDKDEHWQWECIITPETDLTNPIILRLIRNQQKQYAGDPPQPAEAAPGKLDWRPVYKWYRRHPLFTIEEIAKRIGHDPQTVRQTFAELEAKRDS